MILLGMYDYGVKSGFKSYVLGSSGGIDSAVVLSLACLAFGAENVVGIKMPSQYSSSGSLDDATKLHTNWGCKEFLCPITGWDGDVKDIDLNLELEDKSQGAVAYENFQARRRGQIVMHYSNKTGALALGTTNRTEQSVGYGTLFGDLASTINPIGDLYKMEVYALARSINDLMMYRDKISHIIPAEIIEKAPSAELAPGQTDEASLAPYPYLDLIYSRCLYETLYESFWSYR